MATSGYNAYRHVDIQTASQEKLIVMLFNGAIKRASDAKKAMAEQDIAKTHEHLTRAQDIIAELRSALNMETGEVAQNLDRVYEYLYHLLVAANVNKTPETIDECVRHLERLRDTWQELFDSMAQGETDTPAAHNQHGHTIMNFEG